MDRREFQATIFGLLSATIVEPVAAQVPQESQDKRVSLNAEYRAVTKKVLDRIVNDPTFRKQLLDDPEQALADAGFVKELEAIQVPVAAECRTTCGYRSCTFSCVGNTCYISCRNVAL